jgi:orotate phosphoribosyltransferase
MKAQYPMHDSIKAALRSLVVDEPRLSALGDTGELAVRMDRLLLSHYGISRISKKMLGMLPCDDRIDYVAAPELSGVSLAVSMSDHFIHDDTINVLVIRKEDVKGRSRIEGGPNIKGCTAVIVDDVLGTGATTFDALMVLRHAGCQVSLALFVLERESLGGRAMLKQHGIEVRSIATSKEIGATQPHSDGSRIPSR